MSRIKICGLTRQEDISAVNMAVPDYIGFVFAPKSRRFLPLEKAAALKRGLLPEIQAAGVFVNAPLHEVMRAAQEKIIDVIQLHGTEDEAYIEKLRKETALPIIKAYPARGPRDIAEANSSAADMILLDTYRSGSFGGSGETFGWELLSGLKRPFFLAGGIGLSNLGEALATGAYGIDVSSGAEGADGKKDAEKIKQIVAMVRKAESKGGN